MGLVTFAAKPMPRFYLFLLMLCFAFAFAAKANQTALSDGDVLALAGDKYANGELPLGDQHYTLDGPRTGYIWLCHNFGDPNGGGAQHDGPWVHGSTWNAHEKPAVQGSVKWPDARFSVSVENGQRILDGNGLPLDHATGSFPIRSSDPASAYDRNPNSIRAQNIHEVLPANPVYADTPNCMGMEVGYMLDGVPIFNGFDAGLRDAAAHEVQDACEGHPEKSGQYHYHSLSSCLRDAGVKTVIGYALDGFPITGPMAAAGKYLTTADLDECHGITSEIIQDGKSVVSYHYVMTPDFPYSVSCFRGKPVRIGPADGDRTGNGGGMMGGMNNAGFNGGPGGPPGGGPPHRPPPEALDACSGKSDGDACGFTSPRGDQISGSCRTPPGSGLACVPAR
jgi:hypothetical protein